MATRPAHCVIGFRHLLATLLIGSLAVVAAAAVAAAEPRTALVVGNSA